MENCLECGELLDRGEVGFCGCCLFVRNDTGVQGDDVAFSWGVADDLLDREIRTIEVEIEAVAAAIEDAWCVSSRDSLKRRLGMLKADLHELLKMRD